MAVSKMGPALQLSGDRIMTQSQSALPLSFDEPVAQTSLVLDVARRIASKLSIKEPVERASIKAMFADVTGGSDANADWSVKDFGHAVEAALILAIQSMSTELEALDGSAMRANIDAITQLLPRRNVRSLDQMAFQQFSTPLWLGGLMAQLAASARKDGLAIFATRVPLDSLGQIVCLSLLCCPLVPTVVATVAVS